MADAAPAAGLTLLLSALAGRRGRVQWAPPPDASETPRPARAVIDDGHVLLPGSLAPALHAAAIAREGFRTAAEDAVDIAGRIRVTGQP